MQTTWVYDDGGRAQAGYLFHSAGDCVARAIAIATEMPYQVVVDIIDKAHYGRKGGSQSGSYDFANRGILTALGWKRVTTKAHLNSDEFPPGRLILEVSSHMVALIDGVIHDTYDPSYHGSRRVYAYWVKVPTNADIIDHAIEKAQALRSQLHV